MSNFSMILLVFICIGGLALIGFLFFALKKSKEFRREAQDEYLETYNVACAGSPLMDTPRKIKSISVTHNKFESKNGVILDPAKYDKFIVKGNSMILCNIQDNDLIFVNKGFNNELNELEKPKIVVIKRENSKKDQCGFKLRRAWVKCKGKECIYAIKKVINSEEFRVIKESKFYDGNSALINDLENVRLKRFLERQDNPESKEVVISTTFHTDTKKIRFSIHPVEDIIGEVSESFSINKN